MRAKSDDCKVFQDRLADFVEDCLSPDERRFVEDHLTGCQRCRGLLDIVHGNLDMMSAHERDELSDGILDQTSGSACSRAHELFGDYVEGTLPGADEELLVRHLERCSECATVSEALSWLLPQLREMQLVEPDRLFSADVVRRTSGEHGKGFGWLERAQEWWRRQLIRPTFEWQFAYVGAVLLVAICGTPRSPLWGTQLRVQEVLDRVSSETMSTISAPVIVIQDEVVSLGQTVWLATGQRVATKTGALARNLQERRHGMSPHLSNLNHHAGVFLDTVGERDIVQAAVIMRELQYDLQQISLILRKGSTDEPSRRDSIDS